MTSNNYFRQLLALHSKPPPDFHVTTFFQQKDSKTNEVEHAWPPPCGCEWGGSCRNVINCIPFLNVRVNTLTL